MRWNGLIGLFLIVTLTCCTKASKSARALVSNANSADSGTVEVIDDQADVNGADDDSDLDESVDNEDNNDMVSTSVCSLLGKSTVLKSAAIDIHADISGRSEVSNHGIVGIGVRIANGSGRGLYLKVAPLLSTGVADSGSTYSYRSGDLGKSNAARGEMYLELPLGYFAYGVGIGSDLSGEHVEVLKLYGAKLNANGTVTSTIQCLMDLYGAQGCASVKKIHDSYKKRYQEFISSDHQVLRGVGFGMSNNGVTKLWVMGAPFNNKCSE